MHIIDYTITRVDDEIDITVEYSVAPYYPAQTYGPPEFCSPAEGGEITSLEAYRGGDPFKLTSAEERAIEEWIYENHDYDERACR